MSLHPNPPYDHLAGKIPEQIDIEQDLFENYFFLVFDFLATLVALHLTCVSIKVSRQSFKLA